ncbi:hypothetical protein DFP72DRAFT_851526 [Ephemerocybe angulata]|uniref:Uncharacterized protein n=1 Tax=Ephemerocybe angulata TaxID=980116 RepID=A0A8H6M1B1_9AGAR|nr:hypothetical protein DFP72DRAFT_851526 [Tulosesus angulatus]
MWMNISQPIDGVEQSRSRAILVDIRWSGKLSERIGGKKGEGSSKRMVRRLNAFAPKKCYTAISRRIYQPTDSIDSTTTPVKPGAHSATHPEGSERWNVDARMRAAWSDPRTFNTHGEVHCQGATYCRNNPQRIARSEERLGQGTIVTRG